MGCLVPDLELTPNHRNPLVKLAALGQCSECCLPPVKPTMEAIRSGMVSRKAAEAYQVCMHYVLIGMLLCHPGGPFLCNYLNRRVLDFEVKTNR